MKMSPDLGAEPTAGIHNLFLVFPGGQVQAVDWLTFTTSEQETR